MIMKVKHRPLMRETFEFFFKERLRFNDRWLNAD